MRTNGKLIAATLIFAGGSIFAVWSLWKGGGPPPPAPVAVAPSPATLEDTAIIEGAIFVVPGEEEPVERVVSDAMRTAKLSFDSLPSEDKLYADRGRALLGVAEDRLSLYLDPSWETYASQVRSLTGKEPSVSREEWEREAEAYRGLPVDAGAVRIQARYRMGESRQLLGDGSELRRKDASGTYYGSDMLHHVGIEKKGLDVYDLSIPMRFPDLLYPPEEFEAFLVLSFYWDVDRNRWIPWQTVIRDPSPDESTEEGPPRRRMSPPWL